ncbi:MAG: hypothetical protein AAF467_13765 [Actinomycetota bacterium]
MSIDLDSRRPQYHHQQTGLRIAPTQNGPAGSGHGGVSGGRFAALVEPDAARVRFLAPIPLGADLDASRRDDGVVVHHDGVDIAIVADLDGPLIVGGFPALPDPITLDRAQRTWLDARDGQHMAPTCFACGNERASHLGGLGLRPGPIGNGLYAARWTPSGRRGGARSHERVPSWLVWAAMDCPTGFPAISEVAADEAVLTGELAVQVLERVEVDVPHVIMSRLVARSGRRLFTEAALFAPHGARVAVATATWVSVPMAALPVAA